MPQQKYISQGKYYLLQAALLYYSLDFSMLFKAEENKENIEIIKNYRK